MSHDRYKEIMNYLWFDLNKKTRSEKIRIVQFPLLSEIWNTCIENCLLFYKTNGNITIDEQLFIS